MNTKNEIKALTDETLDEVVGGLNPQPLPPGPEMFRSFASIFFRHHFSLPALNIFRFF
jgi:hypothetical protein